MKLIALPTMSKAEEQHWEEDMSGPWCPVCRSFNSHRSVWYGIHGWRCRGCKIWLRSGDCFNAKRLP